MDTNKKGTTEQNLLKIFNEIGTILRDGDNIYLRIQALYADKYGHIPSVGSICNYLRDYWGVRKNKSYKQRDTEGSYIYRHKSGKLYRMVQIEQGRWEPEHILIAKAVGIWRKGLVIHHIDGNGLNNDPCNLVAMDRAEHSRLHGQMRATPEWRKEMSRKIKAAWARKRLAARVAEINSTGRAA